LGVADRSQSHTLVYKRTHPGDPDQQGRFGIRGCMGRVRAWDFDSVIGVGGIGAEAESHGLSGKINWIGIGARKSQGADIRAPLVTFDHFRHYGSGGPALMELAPRLACRIYSRNVRVLLKSFTDGELEEVRRVLRLARTAPPSGAVMGWGRDEWCEPECPPGRRSGGKKRC
jgi:hypothetical protein